MTNRPSGKTMRAVVARDALDAYFASGTAKALKDALTVAPELARETVWDQRFTRREKVYDEDDKTYSDAQRRGER